VIDPMLKFLSSILHPDGEIPLLSDSGFLEAPSVQEIDSVAKLNERSLDLPLAKSDMISLGGYQIFRSDTMFGICDFGSIAAPKLPAHGHCDATNLEISIEGNRWIVDSGNFNYINRESEINGTGLPFLTMAIRKSVYQNYLA